MHWFHLKIYFKVDYVPCVTGLVKSVKTVLERSTVLIMFKKKKKITKLLAVASLDHSGPEML